MKSRRSTLALALVVTALFARPGEVFGQAGQVDLTFAASLGLAGKTNATVLQPDGKVLLVGTFPRGIVRLNADSSLDPSFLAALSSGGTISRVALQVDGKIVIAGSFVAVSGATRNGVARLNPDGSLDATFDPGTANYRPVAAALSLQSDGRVLLGGSGMARLNPDGSSDATFTVLAGPGGGTITQFAPLADGRILVAGTFTSFNGSSPRNSLVRLDSTGALDLTFASPSTPTTIQIVLPVAAGKIWVGGTFDTFSSVTRGGLARLNADGSVDGTFAGQFAAAGTPTVASLVPTPDGRVVVGGIFATANGIARPNLCRLDASGGTDSAFTPETSAALSAGVRQVALAAGGRAVVLTQSQILLRFNTDGSLDASFAPDPAPGPNARVRAVAPQPDGKALVGGEFTAFSGKSVNYLVRLNSDGSVDSTFVSAAPAVVVSIALQADGNIVLGCLVNAGTPTPGVLRLTSSGGLDATFTPPSAGTYPAQVGRVALQPDGRILVTGLATGQAGGTAALGRLNLDGTVDASFTFGGAAGTFFQGLALAPLPDGRSYVGGSAAASTVFGPFGASYARLNSDGSRDTGFSLTPATSGDEVLDFALQRDGHVILAQKSMRGVQRINADGSIDLTFNAGSANSGPTTVRTCAIQRDGRVLIGGDFSTFEGAAVSRLARLNPNGSVDASFSPAAITAAAAPTSVRTLALLPDGRILIGGDFTNVGSQVRNYVARLNPDGSLDGSFVPGAGAPSVASIALQNDGYVVIGGNFRSAGNQPANALARLLPDGTLDVTFQPGLQPGDVINTLVRNPVGGAIFAAGPLTSLSPRAPLALARPSGLGAVRASAERPDAGVKVSNPVIRTNAVTGGIDATFRASADDTISALALQADGRVLVAGQFEALNVDARFNLGRLGSDGATDPTFAPSINAPVRAVAVQDDGRIVVGGEFGTVNGAPALRVARLAADGSSDPTFAPGTVVNGVVLAIRLQSDGRILLGGSFTAVQGQPRIALARLNANGSLDTTFNPDTVSATGGLPTVNTIDLQPDGRVIIGGLFDAIGSTARRNVARLNAIGQLDTAFDQPAGGPDAMVRTMRLQPDGRTLIGGDFSTVDAAVRAGAARLLGDQSSLTSLALWRSIYFGTTDNLGQAANAFVQFNDGITNLEKYAFNLDPLRPDYTRMTATGTKGLPLVGRGAGGRLTVTFVRRTTASLPAVSYGVEFASTLAGPFAVNTDATSTVTAIDPTWERVVFTDSLAPPGVVRRFARVRISDP